MINNHLRLSSGPLSAEYWGLNVKKLQSPFYSQTGNDCMMNDRSNERNRPSMYSGLPGDGNYFPFWARKCGCAECIIASDKTATKSIHNHQSGYKTPNQSEYYVQATNGYNQMHQTKGHLGEDQVYNAHSALGYGNSINVWPEKDRLTASADRMQTHDFNGTTYIQNQADHNGYRFYHSAAVSSQSEATPAVDNNVATSNPFTQLQLSNTSSVNTVNTSNHPVPTFWPWYGTSNEVNYQNQQHLSNIHQIYTTEKISRDPRLRKKSERSSENDTSASNKNSIYQANDNLVPESQMRKNDGYPHKSEENKKNWKEKECSSLREPTTETWRNVSPGGHHHKHAHAPTYPERSAATNGRTNGMPGDEWKGQRISGKQPMQLTLNELSNKRAATFPLGTDSHRNFPWDHSSHALVKTSGKSEEDLSKETKWTPKELKDKRSQKRHGTGDLDKLEHGASPQKTKQSRIHKKDLEIDQDAKNLEIYAREERIRNLKTLLVKHEQTLDALRFQRKSSYFGEPTGNTLNVTNNGTFSPKPGDQEEVVGEKEESCSWSDGILGNSLKRRWLKNWSEEDQLDHKPTETNERRNEVNSHDTQSEEQNQNLSNAEFTALEGLVRLSKD